MKCNLQCQREQLQLINTFILGKYRRQRLQIQPLIKSIIPCQSSHDSGFYGFSWWSEKWLLTTRKTNWCLWIGSRYGYISIYLIWRGAISSRLNDMHLLFAERTDGVEALQFQIQICNLCVSINDSFWGNIVPENVLRRKHWPMNPFWPDMHSQISL